MTPSELDALVGIVRRGIEVLNRQGYAIQPEDVEDRARNIVQGIVGLYDIKPLDQEPQAPVSDTHDLCSERSCFELVRKPAKLCQRCTDRRTQEALILHDRLMMKAVRQGW